MSAVKLSMGGLCNPVGKMKLVSKVPSTLHYHLYSWWEECSWIEPEYNSPCKIHPAAHTHTHTQQPTCTQQPTHTYTLNIDNCITKWCNSKLWESLCLIIKALYIEGFMVHAKLTCVHTERTTHTYTHTHRREQSFIKLHKAPICYPTLFKHCNCTIKDNHNFLHIHWPQIGYLKLHTFCVYLPFVSQADREVVVFLCQKEE